MNSPILSGLEGPPPPCTIITHSLLCRAADNQSQYLIYITWSLAAISNYEPVVRWRQELCERVEVTILGWPS